MTKVSMAYVHGTDVTFSWHQCVMAMISHDVVNNQHVIGAQWLATKYGTGGIVQARNDTVTTFLKTDSDYLFWIDTDMGFAPDTVDRLVACADPVKRPIVGGLCFMNRELGPDGMGGMFIQPVPTIFDWWKNEVGGGFTARTEYERDQLIQVAATGSACILIHRSALEKIEAEYGKTWYSPVRSGIDGAFLSEDLSLCMRAAAMEIPIHIHTGIKTSHFKHMWLDERLADRITKMEKPS